MNRRSLLAGLAVTPVVAAMPAIALPKQQTMAERFLADMAEARHLRELRFHVVRQLGEKLPPALDARFRELFNSTLIQERVPNPKGGDEPWYQNRFIFPDGSEHLMEPHESSWTDAEIYESTLKRIGWENVAEYWKKHEAKRMYEVVITENRGCYLRFPDASEFLISSAFSESGSQMGFVS